MSFLHNVILDKANFELWNPNLIEIWRVEDKQPSQDDPSNVATLSASMPKAYEHQFPEHSKKLQQPTL
jgi:hypothetical protein